MADGFQRIIQELQKHEPSTLAAHSEEWGAGQASFRQNIRGSAKSNLEAAGLTDLDCFSILDAPPRPKDWSVSISHAKGIGAWVAVKRPAKIGLDIEEVSRVREDIIERVSTTQEILSAPQPAFLWCAKESYFKSLEEHQPIAVTQLKILRWEKLEENLYSFHGSNALGGEGLVLLATPYIYSVCLVPSGSF